MKKKNGRPTKFEEKFCEALIEHMSQGLSFESFAGVIGVDRDTIYEWVKVNPSFSDAKKIATSFCLLFWEKIGIAGVWNTKETQLNTGNYVFQMKNRFKWTDKVELQAGENVRPVMLSYQIDNRDLETDT